MKQTAYIYLLTLSCLLCACNRENRTNLPQPQVTGVADSLETVPPEEKPKAISAEQIEIKKDLLYDKYTLEDTYPYKDTTRSFQWDKIKERLRLAVIYDMKKLDIPGSYPYEKPPMTQFPFNVETNEYCIYCMLCAGVCPMKAISDSNPRDINNDVCVRCGACIRICPAQAKSFTKEPLEALRNRLLRPLCDTRQEPWYTVG